MSSRERRIVHLALRDHADLRTQSEGEGLRRYVVVISGELQAAQPGHPLKLHSASRREPPELCPY